MPITRTSTTLQTQVDGLDTFIPEETYTTLSECLATYGLTSSETIVVTDDSWTAISNTPTSVGVLRLSSTNVSAIFTLCKNSSTNNVNKISSVINGSVYFDARWTGANIEIRAVNNSSSISITVLI